MNTLIVFNLTTYVDALSLGLTLLTIKKKSLGLVSSGIGVDCTTPIIMGYLLSIMLLWSLLTSKLFFHVYAYGQKLAKPLIHHQHFGQFLRLYDKF
ncbi:MAG: hypothetical protein ACI9VT_003989 [Psychroserpens sp.]|jgi:hypothetical protein